MPEDMGTGLPFLRPSKQALRCFEQHPGDKGFATVVCKSDRRDQPCFAEDGATSAERRFGLKA